MRLATGARGRATVRRRPVSCRRPPTSGAGPCSRQHSDAYLYYRVSTGKPGTAMPSFHGVLRRDRALAGRELPARSLATLPRPRGRRARVDFAAIALSTFATPGSSCIVARLSMRIGATRCDVGDGASPFFSRFSRFSRSCSRAGTRSSESTPSARTPAYENLQTFTNILAIVQKNYVEEVHDRSSSIEGAINGMLDLARSAQRLPDARPLQGAAGRHQGQLRRPRHRDHGTERRAHRRVADRGHARRTAPASKAGDQVIKIDGEFTKDMTLVEAVKKMRGPKGSKVVALDQAREA